MFAVRPAYGPAARVPPELPKVALPAFEPVKLNTVLEALPVGVGEGVGEAAAVGVGEAAGVGDAEAAGVEELPPPPHAASPPASKAA
jgi:hypothetical protein